jgi:hypothetical protein
MPHPLCQRRTCMRASTSHREHRLAIPQQQDLLARHVNFAQSGRIELF